MRYEDVTILGAGIIGICTALSLVSRGAKVRLIDRGEPGQETSYGNAGVISPWSFVPQSMPGLWRQVPKLMFGKYKPLSILPASWPQMIPWGIRFLSNCSEAQLRRGSNALEILCAPSVELYRRHLEGTGQEFLIQDSAYVHAFRDASRASLDGIDYQIRREKGASLELVGSDRLREIEPFISSEFQAAILIHGQARAQSPGEIAAALAQKAQENGVAFVRAPIEALSRREKGWDIRCRSETFSSNAVVVALGAWSRDLLRPLGIDIPLVAERGYHIEIENPGIEINNSVMDTDAKVVASSMLGGVRVAGQAEFGPADAPPSPEAEPRLKRVARSIFPDLAMNGVRFWMGRRPTLPDNVPMIGEFPGNPGLFAAFGHSHWGLMSAPKTGEIVADMVRDTSVNIDLSAFHPARF